MISQSSSKSELRSSGGSSPFVRERRVPPMNGLLDFDPQS